MMHSKKARLLSSVIAIAAIVALFVWYRPGGAPEITTFEQCAALYPVMESYPEQCNTPDGKHFVRQINQDLSDLIRVDSVKPNATVSSPLTITGAARGTWFFEASFPVFLTDWDGKIIAQGLATAQPDPTTGETNWMTTEFVPFKATLLFTPDPQVYSPRGTLILKKDNPSGLPQYDAALEMPVTISAGTRSQAAAYDKAVTITKGAQAVFPDGLLVTLSMVNDSRCNPNVQCIWEGELQTVLLVDRDGVALLEKISLGTVNNKTTALGPYTFRLQSATETSATIVVSKAASVSASGVSGYVHVGPTCPVEKMPPDPDCADKPLSGATVSIWKDGSTSASAFGTTDDFGRFTITVPPGSYNINAGIAAVLPRCTPTRVTVLSGSVSEVDIACDSGIR